MQPSSAVRPIVNGKVSAFRSTMREPGIKSSAVSSGKNGGEHPALARYWVNAASRSEEHTSELQSLMRISYAVFCLKKKQKSRSDTHTILMTTSRLDIATDIRM